MIESKEKQILTLEKWQLSNILPFKNLIKDFFDDQSDFYVSALVETSSGTILNVNDILATPTDSLTESMFYSVWIQPKSKEAKHHKIISDCFYWPTKPQVLLWPVTDLRSKVHCAGLTVSCSACQLHLQT